MTSLKGHRRNQLASGRTTSVKNRSLWMTYSPKMNADLSILGDLEIIHWATELESDPSVVTYRFDEEVDVSLHAHDVDDFTKLRGIWVVRKDGSVELHQIDASEKLDPDLKTTPIRYRRTDQVVHQAQLVSITYAHLALLAYQLGFWLKVIAMASQVRGYVLDHETELTGTQVLLTKEGTIRSLLADLPIKDPAIALGVVCRLVISGSILVEVGKQGFGYNTVWRSP
jgi:hypothetical protein